MAQKCDFCGMSDEEGVITLSDDSINGIDYRLCVFCHSHIIELIKNNKEEIGEKTKRAKSRTGE